MEPNVQTIQSRNGAKVNVLIVDDSPDSLLALEAILGGMDRNVVKASSGQEALKYLLKEDVGIILLDVKMAGMDGYETAAIIRERDKTRDVPIIFLTAYHKDETDVAKGYSHGAVDFMFKPIVPDVLKSKVDVFVELSRRTAELKRKNVELERAQKELLRTKAAESLIKHAPDPLFVSDLDGKILQANDAATELLGVQPGELVEQSLSRFLSQEETAAFIAALREAAKKGVVRNAKLHPCSSTGEVIPTTLNASALRGQDGEILGVIGILRDMREYTRVLRDLERSKSDLQDKISELEKFEEVVIGRELKMIQLERELSQFRTRSEPPVE
jgi:PAS domain S-box-containing protein